MKRNGYKAAIPIVSGIAYVANPRMLPDLPVEVTVRSERIGTKTRELTPGVRVVAQISRTGKEVWITHGEQRLFLYLQDEQGRVSLFYQSFSGTGGKAQGYWFPSGGILADQRGSGVWVIKGNPKTDPGAGREGLLALYEKANAVLPQSDAETDAFVKKVTRVDYDDLMYKDEYEIQPTMKILEEGHANALQSKWNNWAYRFWALNALDKTFGKRTFNIKENPLVGFARVPWKPGYSPRSEATFLSTAYPRLWEEALKNTELKIRVLIARDAAHMGDIGKNLMSIDAAAKRGGEIVILILALSSQSSYALEDMIDETKPMVGDSQRLSRPSPFMLMHNLAESLMSVPKVESMVMRKLGHSSVPRSSIDPARVDTWAGRRGALEDSGNALADLFAKYVTTGKVAYKGTVTENSRIKKDLDVMVDYLKRNPGVYEILSGYHKLPASDSDLNSLSTPAPRTKSSIGMDWHLSSLDNPKDLAGRHIPDRYLAGLPSNLQLQRIGELTQSRDDYKRGDFSELPTDRIARKMGLVKQSNYTTEAKKRGVEWRGDAEDMARRVLQVYSGRAPAQQVAAFSEALRKSFAKGLAAWKSGGHRPGASPQNWAVARVNSLVVGGKTSWTADKKLFEVLPAAVREKIEAMRAKQNPLRRNPVEDKQEQQEVWKLLGLGKGKQRKLERQAVKKLEELKTDPKLAEDLVNEALLYAAAYIFRLADYSDIVADLDRWSSEFWRVAERYVETNAHLAAEHSHASPPARRRAEQIKQQAASLTRLTGTKPTLAELSKSLTPVRGAGMTPDQIRTTVAAGRPPILLAIDTLSHKDRKHLQLPEVAATYQTDAEQLQEQKNLTAFAQAQLSETEKKVLERSLADSPNWAQLGLTVAEGKYRAAAAVMKLRNTVRALQAHNIAQAHVLELSDVAKVYADSSPRRIILTADGEEMDVQGLRDSLRGAEDRAAEAEVRLLTTSGNTNILDQWEAERRRLDAREAVLIEAIPEGTRGRW